MEVGLWLLQRQHRLALCLIKLGKEVLHEGVEQKDYGEALDALAVLLERQPRPIRFVA